MSNSKNSKKLYGGGAEFPRPIRDSKGAPRGVVYSGASSGKGGQRLGALLGFVILVSLNGALFMLAVSVLNTAGIVSWTLGYVDAVRLSALVTLWRALDTVVLLGMKEQTR